MWPFKKTEQRNQDNLNEIKTLVQELSLHLSNGVNELKAQIKENRIAIECLERKLVTKDLKDKQLYGQLHYKLHEVKPTQD